jgi:hypothetical protein
MSRRLVFHYARPDGIYDDWFLVPTYEGNVGPRQSGPFGVCWHVELDDAATAFTYQVQLQRPAGQEQSDQTSELVKTDPTGNQDQTVPLEPDVSEVLYPSGYVWKKRAYTVPISWPDADHYAIREQLDRLTRDVGSISDAVVYVDSRLSDIDGKSDRLLTVTGDIDGRIDTLAGKSNTIVDVASEVHDKVGDIDGKSDRLLSTGAAIGEDIHKLLARVGVIVFGEEPQAPEEVERLAVRAADVVADLATGLEAARTTFAPELAVRSTPAALLPTDSRGQAVEQIVGILYFGQLAAEDQRRRLQQLVDDKAASGAQDLVALRAQLRATADQIEREVRRVEALAGADPADLKLLKTLGDKVRPGLIQLRQLTPEVAP